jgi:hypothetical protein
MLKNLQTLPILSQGTNQARRRSRKRPGPPRLRKAGRGLPRRTRGDGGASDQLDCRSMSLLPGLKEGTERESVTAITLWSYRKKL